MFILKPDGSAAWNFRGGGGPGFGFSSFGSGQGSGEFGADANALSQSTREQWEMFPGHSDWDGASPGSAGALYAELTGRSDLRRLRDVASPYLLAVGSRGQAPGGPSRVYWTVDDRLWLISAEGVISPLELEEEVVVVAQRDPAKAAPDPVLPPGSLTGSQEAGQAPAPTTVTRPTVSASGAESPRARSTAESVGRVARQAPPAPRSHDHGWSSATHWLYQDSLGILYNGGSRDPFPQSLPVDTGSVLGNYAINSWLSLSNVVAGYLSAATTVANNVDEFFNEHLGYGAIQTLPPLSKTMAIAVETGPALEYSALRLSTWWSAVSKNPRVLEAVLAPIFGTLTVAGRNAGSPRSATSAANLEHVLHGGSSDRGIAVFHIDVSRLTPAELEAAVSHVKDIDFQAGVANGLVRTAVPSRSTATNSSAALARQVLGLGDAEKAGHVPDVAGGGSALGPITGLPTYVNSSIAGQWGRYAPGFKFDGFSLINRATGEFLYVSLGLENEPAVLLGF